MVKQNDPLMDLATQHFGCLEFSLLFKVEKRIRPQNPFGGDEIKAIASSAILNGFLTPGKYDAQGNALDGCLVEDATDFLHLAGAPNARLLQATAADGTLTNSWPITTPIPSDVEVILQWFCEATGFTHYTDGNPDLSLEWDTIQYPDGSGSNTVKNGKVVGLHLVQFQ